MTYWAINGIFLAVVAVVALAAVLAVGSGRRAGVPWRSVGIAMVVVLLLTAVFDNVLIGIGIVGYDPSKISGKFIGVAPLEDFAYAVAAVVLLPSLWILLGKRMTLRPHTAPPTEPSR